MAPTSTKKSPPCAACGKRTNLDVFRDPTKGTVTEPWRNICRKCRFYAQKRTWATFTEWERCLWANTLYLNRQIDVSTIYGIPLDPETDPIVDGLIRLYEYGLLTTSSQPGVIPKIHFKVGQGAFQVSQRPYLHFLIPTVHEKINAKRVNALVSRLLKDQSIVTTVWSNCDDYPKSSEGTINESREVASITQATLSSQAEKDGNEYTDKTYYFRSTAPPDPDDNWATLRREAATRSELGSAEWTQQTRLGWVNVDEIPDGYSQCSKDVNYERFPIVVNARPPGVQIVARQWDPDLDLQFLVLNYCQGAGLKKAFKHAIWTEEDSRSLTWVEPEGPPELVEE